MAVSLPEQLSQLEPDQALSYVQAEEGDSLQQVMARQDWQDLPNGANLGYTDKVYWYRLPLYNASAASREILFEVAYGLLDHLSFYQLAENRLISQYRAGDKLPFSQRPLLQRNFVFPLQFAGYQQQVVYLRVQTSGAQQVPIHLWSREAYLYHSERDAMIRSVFYGMQTSLVLFILFIWVLLREKLFLFYTLCMGSFILLAMALQGVAFQWLYPESPGLHEAIILTGVPLTLLFASLYSREFLILAANASRWDRIYRIQNLLLVLATILSLLLPYGLSTRISVFMSVPVCLLMQVSGIYCWYRGEKTARLFSAAWFCLMGGILWFVLNKLGILPTTMLSEYSIMIGACLQALLLTFAMAERTRSETVQKLRAFRKQSVAQQQQLEAEEKLVAAMSHHPLTGLPGKHLFEHFLLEVARPGPEQRLAVVLCHIASFDDVNKTLGYRNADVLLRMALLRLNRYLAASRLVMRLEQENCLAHIEGVTFAFCLAGRDENEIRPKLAEVHREFCKPLDYLGLSLSLNLKIGCSMPFAGKSITDGGNLLRQAFIAFDQTTLQHPIAFFTAADGDREYSPVRLTMMTELRFAIENNKLSLYFQPQINIQNGQLCGFEALLRWSHPEYGMVRPDHFIPLAERAGLMPELTRWVLQTASQFCRHVQQLAPGVTVSVNISTHNLQQDDFVEQVQSLFSAEDPLLACLILEVTETAAMEDADHALAVLHALHAYGLHLSIDDFGTGYSSLAYIKRMPVSEIKIDRSFICNMSQSRDDELIVATVIAMCHQLGYQVVAEGVENDETCKSLRQMGCDIVQGYHFSRPLPAEEAMAFARRWSASADKGSSLLPEISPPAPGGGHAAGS